MRDQMGPIRVAALATLLLLAPGSAFAGRTDNDGKPPTEGSTHGSGWNPSFTCTIGPGETLDDLLECLADGLSHQGPGPCPPITTPDLPTTVGDDPDEPVNLQLDGGGGSECNDPMAPPGFWATRWLPCPPHYGLEIRKIDGSEIDRLVLWEDDPSIQMTYIEVERPGLGARIGTFVERPDPSGGLVTVTVNGLAVSLDTAVLKRPDDLSRELVAQLRNAGFHAWIADLYIIAVTNPPCAGVTSLRFQSDNPGVASSDLALLPIEELPLGLESPGILEWDPCSTVPLPTP